MNKIIKSVAIIGVGLIGGSIALRLKMLQGKNITIYGICNHTKRSLEAKRQGIIDKILPTLSHAFSCDLIIIATPIAVTVTLIKKLSKVKTQRNPLVIDVASTKELICQTAEKSFSKEIAFIGTHPMAGTEDRGFEFSDPYLFTNKPWVLCKTSRSTKEDITELSQFITSLGAKPISVTPQVHDQVVAGASHIFLVTTSALIGAISKNPQWKTISQIASTGFRDSTRLASHNPEMKRDIVISNKHNVLDTLKNLRLEIVRFESMLKAEDEKNVLKYFFKTKTIRDHWLEHQFS